MNRSPLPLLALALGCAAHPGASGPDTSATPPAASVELAPGVVFSADEAAVYVMAPGGGIEALSLARGEPHWHSREADRPLALAAGRLLAQVESPADGGGLSLAFLDPRTGGVTMPAVAVPLPPGVRPLIDQTLGEEFRLGARSKGPELLLFWSYVERPVTGVSPAPGEPPVMRRVDGGVRVDPAAGTAVALGPAELEERDPPPPAARRDLEGEPPGARPPWRSDGLWVAVEATRQEGAALQVRLRRWRHRDGEELPPLEIFRGPAAGVLPSADGRHLMVGSPAVPGAAQPWSWRLFAVDTGRLAGVLPAERSLAPFLAAGARVLHLAPPGGRRIGQSWVETPLRVRAVGLEEGNELWTRPVRDTTFRGPRPPGQGPRAVDPSPRHR